jgi:holo-[acyl-carrier protein] synthase
MMSLGVDIVDVARFGAALRRWPRLAARIFTDDELATCLPSRDAEDRLAARFAAKEATFKALGDGWPRLSYHDVEVGTGVAGAPVLSLHSEAARRAAGRHAAVSLAHAGGLAIAEVAFDADAEGSR